jgi:hypothetical protein
MRVSATTRRLKDNKSPTDTAPHARFQGLLEKNEVQVLLEQILDWSKSNPGCPDSNQTMTKPLPKAAHH